MTIKSKFYSTCLLSILTFSCGKFEKDNSEKGEAVKTCENFSEDCFFIKNQKKSIKDTWISSYGIYPDAVKEDMSEASIFANSDLSFQERQKYFDQDIDRLKSRIELIKKDHYTTDALIKTISLTLKEEIRINSFKSKEMDSKSLELQKDFDNASSCILEKASNEDQSLGCMRSFFLKRSITP